MIVVAKSAADYLAQLPEELVETTRRLLSLFREWLPGAEERVQWGIAILALDGRDITGIAVRKGFYSLYVPNPEVVARYVPLLGAPGTVDAGKGCIRFKRLDDLDLAALERMVAELADRVTPATATSG